VGITPEGTSGESLRRFTAIRDARYARTQTAEIRVEIQRGRDRGCARGLEPAPPHEMDPAVREPARAVMEAMAGFLLAVAQSSANDHELKSGVDRILQDELARRGLRLRKAVPPSPSSEPRCPRALAASPARSHAHRALPPPVVQSKGATSRSSAVHGLPPIGLPRRSSYRALLSARPLPARGTADPAGTTEGLTCRVLLGIAYLSRTMSKRGARSSASRRGICRLRTWL
jgi:hypothetical protein